jgi:1-acyl-sn-glycerol-3-phosphate acyltransferase
MSKKKNKKIQDYDRTYNFLYHYVSFVLKQSYRSILLVGEENIPKDGAIIFAPNHTNTLMDALVVLTIDDNPKVFVARADIFKNRKLAKIFTFLKIMPIMRQRDGFQAVKKNQETIDKAVDVLKDKIPFCIFPEGTHLAKFSSLPLSKGIFKIAFQAHEQMPQVPLYIVPVGIRYGNHFRFRSTIRMEFGKPINVGEYLTDNANLTPQEQMNSMKNLLTERLHATLFRIPNDEDYDATYEVCNAVESIEMKDILGKKSNKIHLLELQHQANNNTLKRIEALKANKPDKAKKLLELGREANKLRKKKGIDVESVSVKKPLLSRIPRVILTLLTLPYTLPISLLASPVVLLCQFIFTKLKDPAFRNSVRFVMNLLVWPLLWMIYGIIAFCLLPWSWALCATLFIMPAPYVAHELWKTMRLVVSDIKFLKEKRLKKIYSQIRGIILEDSNQN